MPHLGTQQRTPPPTKESLVRSYVLSLLSEPHDGSLRMPSERTLAAQLQVSRPTARAALQALTTEGRLVLTPSLGYFAAGVTK